MRYDGEIPPVAIPSRVGAIGAYGPEDKENYKMLVPATVSVPPQKKRSRKLVYALVYSISESIRSCSIRPGDKLPPESVIMAEHGVSRTVAREAITSLQAAGLIETRHGIGSFVRAVPTGLELRIDAASILTVRDILSMLELRISLETESAALAAARRSDGHLDEMRQALDALQANIADGGDNDEPDLHFDLQI